VPVTQAAKVQKWWGDAGKMVDRAIPYLYGWVHSVDGVVRSAAAPMTVAGVCGGMAGGTAAQRATGALGLALCAAEQAKWHGSVVGVDHKPANGRSLLHVREVGAHDLPTSVDVAFRFQSVALRDATCAAEWFITSSSRLSLGGDTVQRKLQQVRAVLAADDCPAVLAGARFGGLVAASPSRNAADSVRYHAADLLGWVPWAPGARVPLPCDGPSTGALFHRSGRGAAHAEAPRTRRVRLARGMTVVQTTGEGDWHLGRWHHGGSTANEPPTNHRAPPWGATLAGTPGGSLVVGSPPGMIESPMAHVTPGGSWVVR